jgi:phospholipid/cholesterol/gamma-HCH transport system substrate-binding protein
MSRPATAPARRTRAARRHTTLGLLVLALLGLVGWISTVAINGVPWASPYQLRVELPPGAPLLTGGDDVRIDGERVGQVSSVSLAHGSRTVAVATLSLTSGGPVHAGASARIRPRGLAGAVYVDLDPGPATARALPSGRLLRTVSGGVQLTDVIAGFDASSRRALGTVLTQAGAGVAGRGVGVNEALSGAPKLLSDLTAVLRALSPAPGALSGLVGSGTVVADALAGPPGEDTLGQLVDDASSVVSATGSAAATIRALPSAEDAAARTLPSADGLLDRGTAAARALAPGVRALADAMPSLVALESHAPAVSTLAMVARAAAPAFAALTPTLAAAQGPASALTPISDPFSEIASVMIPYGHELVQAPLGFTRWGGFRYDFGTGAGHRAVRFSMVMTCGLARDPYPGPGAATQERKPCQG